MFIKWGTNYTTLQRNCWVVISANLGITSDWCTATQLNNSDFVGWIKLLSCSFTWFLTTWTHTLHNVTIILCVLRHNHYLLWLAASRQQSPNSGLTVALRCTLYNKCYVLDCIRLILLIGPTHDVQQKMAKQKIYCPCTVLDRRKANLI